MTRATREARLPLDEAPVAGSVRVLDVRGVRVGLFRVDEQFHALADRCPHRGAPLCSGRVATPVAYEDGELHAGSQASVVRCPWHKWEFEIASGRCVVDDKLRVRRYAVRVEDDQVVVTLDAPA